MKTNTAAAKNETRTHGGATTYPTKPMVELERAVLSCLLWEDQFYESGESIADRIKKLVVQLPPEAVAALAIKARMQYNLRHVPLLLVREMARKGGNIVGRTLSAVIRRADELSEFLSIYWADRPKKNSVLTRQVKLGLAHAFTRFGAYQLGKYKGDADKVKLRDVLFLCHAKPKDEEQAALWKRLIDGTLEVPDTWEVSLSGGANKKETFERLIRENKLGYMALLRNLRNMVDAGCDEALVRAAISAGAKGSKALPFRFLSAAKAAPQFESQLDAAMVLALSENEKLPGKTLVVVDVSGSMYGQAVSKRSEITRAKAAATIAALCREVCENAVIYATAGSDARRVHKTALVPSRHGMALIDAIMEQRDPLGGGGIFLNQTCKWLAEREKDVDRMIVITDEADCGIGAKDAPTNAVPLGKHNYILNVGGYKNGIGYGKWTTISGFSEAVVTYIAEVERANEG